MSNRSALNTARIECEKFVLSLESLLKICDIFNGELKRGLAKATHNNADVKCWNTFVQDFPSGKEVGKFLALDLGGTNFRVLLVTLKGGNDFTVENTIYTIPQDVMVGTGDKLFDHIAECLSSFMKQYNVINEHLPLGFTFSFPVQQLGLTRGILVSWTKGFKCSGVENQDVVQLLKNAIQRRGDINISVMAVLNDTTGTLMSCAHKNHNCRIGVIIGTGCNACYIEKVENVELFDRPPNNKSHVIVNCEWGAFGDSGTLDFIRTDVDKEVDDHSLNAGKQKFEKMISGMYMGEMVRLILLNLVKQKALFGGKSSTQLETRHKFLTKYVSDIEGDINSCKVVFKELGIYNFTNDDCRVVEHVCQAISKRAADLVACGIATLLNKMEESKVTVGVDGSVYRFHPMFKENMDKRIKELTNHNINFDLMLSDDGSGRGAALIAAVASYGQQ